jgi:ribosomal protein L7/L12
MSAPTVRIDRDIFSNNMGHDVQRSPLFKEVREHIQAGNKIEAIKAYREITGLGLKEAKDAVEAIEAGRPLVVMQSTIVAARQQGAIEAAPVSPFNSSAELMDEIKCLLREGNKIEAIRIHREYFNMGLKESKDAVEAVEAELKFEPEPAIESPDSARTVISSGSMFGGSDAAQTLVSNEPVMSANPFDEQPAAPKKNNWVRWAIGCGVALLLLCCCSIIAVAAYLVPISQQ